MAKTEGVHNALWKLLHTWRLVAALCVLICGAGIAAALLLGKSTNCATSACAQALKVVSIQPSDGASAVLPSSTIAVSYNRAISLRRQAPSISPAVPGSWHLVGKKTLKFVAQAPLSPGATYTISFPQSVHSKKGATTTSTTFLRPNITFTVSMPSEKRLEQVLAQLGYLPLSYSPPVNLTPSKVATTQPGTLIWRWGGLPTQLTSQWMPGQANEITKAGIMAFQSVNNLKVDGIAGPQVWSLLINAVLHNEDDPNPVTYVLVTKAIKQHLTVWVNGIVEFQGVLVNTGVPGATTTDGNFAVFSHVKTSHMKGTNITGSTYTDPDVPWVSYFNGGDALHGYPRRVYGYPQSNGCVEMTISVAATIWPYTPIGTLVTVQGQTHPLATTTTTTSTSSTTTTSTTLAAPTARRP